MKRLGLAFALVCSVLVVGTVAHSSAPFVYVVTANQQFGTVNLATGAFYQIGPQTPEGQVNLVWGDDGSLYSLTIAGELETINPNTGQTTVVGQTGLYYNAFSLAGARGRLYLTDFANNLYAVDPSTGSASLIRPTGMPADPNVPFTVNADGTINLCDESFYGLAGTLYATFDSFTFDPNTLAMTPVVAPALYAIDPHTGTAARVASTILNLGATVESGGRFYGFKWVTTGFTDAGPQNRSQLVALDVTSGSVQPLVMIDPAAGGITGAAPVRN